MLHFVYTRRLSFFISILIDKGITQTRNISTYWNQKPLIFFPFQNRLPYIVLALQIRRSGLQGRGE